MEARHGDLTRTWPRPGTRRDSLGDLRIMLVSGALAVLAGALAGLPLALALGVLTAICLFALVAARPVAGSYLLLAATPLLVGVDRGQLVPLLRPSEVLALVVGAAVVARLLFELASGASLRPRVAPLDAVVLALVLAGSVLPLVWMFARGREIAQEDLLYALWLWKYFAGYVIVRVTVREERQVRVCLWIALAASALVGTIGILEALGLLGLPELLARYYTPDGPGTAVEARASSTTGSPFALSDLMLFSLAIAAGWYLRVGTRRLLMAALSVVFVFGLIASGSASGLVGLAAGVVGLGLITRRLGRVALVAAPLTALAGVALKPVIDAKLANLDPVTGLPHSWVGRLDNLQTFFWPEIARDGNWLTGVRLAARVRAPETWRDWVYIESGYTWLVWTGGVVLLVAFLVFVLVGLRTVARVARERDDAVGVAAIASFACLCMLTVLMLLDAHLILRAAADLNFALLALALVGYRPGSRDRGDRVPVSWVRRA